MWKKMKTWQKGKNRKKAYLFADVENSEWVQDIEDDMREITDIDKEREQNADESWNLAQKGKYGKKGKTWQKRKTWQKGKTWQNGIKVKRLHSRKLICSSLNSKLSNSCH